MLPVPPIGPSYWIASRGMQLQFAQKAFIVDSECLLMVRKSGNDPRNPYRWEVPGGRGRPGENLDEHICREVWEEVGISIVPGRPFHVWQWSMPGPTDDLLHFVAVARLCIATSRDTTDAHRVPGDHLDQIRWVPLGNLPEYPLIPDMQPVFEDFVECWTRDYKFSPPEVVDARSRCEPAEKVRH
jgi:8-oxo-dGTP pyrophosphatase MutT (NUDIX family)